MNCHPYYGRGGAAHRAHAAARPHPHSRQPHPMSLRISPARLSASAFQGRPHPVASRRGGITRNAAAASVPSHGAGTREYALGAPRGGIQRPWGGGGGGPEKSPRGTSPNRSCLQSWLSATEPVFHERVGAAPATIKKSPSARRGAHAPTPTGCLWGRCGQPSTHEAGGRSTGHRRDGPTTLAPPREGGDLRRSLDPTAPRKE